AGSRSVTATDTVTATITGKQSAIQVNPLAASSLVVASPSSATAGGAFNMTVTAKDIYGNAATGYTGTVHFSSSETLAALPADYAFLAGDAGVHPFSVTLYASGSRSVTATDTGNAAITKQSTVQVSATAASAFVVTAPSNGTAGTPFNLTVT